MCLACKNSRDVVVTSRFRGESETWLVCKFYRRDMPKSFIVIYAKREFGKFGYQIPMLNTKFFITYVKYVVRLQWRKTFEKFRLKPNMRRIKKISWSKGNFFLIVFFKVCCLLLKGLNNDWTDKFVLHVNASSFIICKTLFSKARIY